MSARTGDKGRYHRERRKRIARRAEMRELRAKLTAASSTSAPAEKK